MVATLILSMSVVLQLLAAVLALRLIKVTGNRLAWILLAVAVFLMAARRSITLGRILFGGEGFQYQADPVAELVALGISICMVVGLALIGPIFRSIEESKSELGLRAIQQEAVAQLGQRALATREISSLMDDAVNLVQQILQAPLCKVLELLPNGKELLLKAGVGWEEGYVGHRTVGAGLDSQAGYTLLKESPLIVEDLRTETRFSGPPLLHKHAVVSGMSVIIQGQEQPFGVLGVHTTTRHVFSQDDVHFLQNVANVLAAAIQRGRAEEALWESQRKSRAWLEHSPLCTKIVDLDFNLQYMSQAGMTGLRIDDITSYYGKPYPLDFYPESFREQMTKNLERVKETGKIATQEAAVVDVDGNTVWFHSTLVPVNDDDGQIEYIIVVSLDTTDRKEAENALRESEERWQFALEGNRDGVWDWNVLSNTVFFSTRWKEMLGFEESEIGDSLDEWKKRLHPDDKERVFADLNRYFEGITPFYQNEHRVLCKDGSYKWILDRGKVISWTEEHQPLRMIGTHTDITDHKQAQNQLRGLYRRLGEAEESERQKIARELHDEFGQLLAVLKMDLGWLTVELEQRQVINKAQFSEKFKSMMTVLDQSIHSVRQVTTMLRPVMLDTLGILPALGWLTQDFQERTGISCNVLEGSEVEDIVINDERAIALFRIAQEFLTNVMRHAKASEVQFTLSVKEGWCVLDMTDNGIGIPPERIHTTDTLGLLGMKERAEMGGGRFIIEGKAGEGTHVTVSLPVEKDRLKARKAEG